LILRFLTFIVPELIIDKMMLLLVFMHTLTFTMSVLTKALKLHVDG